MLDLVDSFSDKWCEILPYDTGQLFESIFVVYKFVKWQWLLTSLEHKEISTEELYRCIKPMLICSYVESSKNKKSYKGNVH